MSTGDDRLDPDVRRFTEAVMRESARLRGAGARDLAEARAIAERVRAPWRAGGPAMAVTREVELACAVGALRLRLYLPAAPARPLPVLLYLHGGGWCMFSIDTHDRLMREYAAAAGIAVLGVDYALAPEHRFPVALEQIGEALAWLRASAPAFGIDPLRIALGGDSVGANMALATALRQRDAGTSAGLRALLLNYGGYDPVMPAGDRALLGAEGAMLTAAEMDGYWHDYLGPHDPARVPALAAPLRAALHGLPPALLVAAERDLLYGQSVELARRLWAAGGTAALRAYAGAAHSFLEAMSVAPLARRAIAESADWLRGRLFAGDEEDGGSDPAQAGESPEDAR
ncbi:alpha/beta hydrolase [Luteimonas sp. RD2P54]|uniref:Alpha/beta hydrolase n=1 Tax=Luteimonas endophytica TaxID=3042023 RepID=A0ABT6J777_9GAMM|nr:alpha/beta hydrolase [Luteimonas endophytica]MDH5822666.1 alpha/beta hydrolase [Luteimonas endophytica]